MFEAELAGSEVVLAVAQRPFEAESETGIVNAFSLLRPILHEGGQPTLKEEFPATGEVWWMLLPTTRAFAEPGRLLTAVLEQGRQAGVPGKSWYQARIDSLKPVRPSDWIEVLQAPPEWIGQERELISRNRTLTLDHPPLDHVYVAWQGHLYGPLRARTEAGAQVGQWGVHFSTANADHTVRKVSAAALQRLSINSQHHLHVELSLNDRPVHLGGLPHICRYHLIRTRAFDQATSAAVRVVLESDEALIKRAARTLLNRSRRQQLGALLEEVVVAAEGTTEASTPAAAQVIKALKGRLEDEDHAAADLAQALLQDGALAPQLQEALRRAEQEHVDKHAARLQTLIDERLREARKVLDEVEKRREAQQRELDQQRRDKLAAADREVEQKLQEADKACQEREEKLQAEKRELSRQRELLSGNLAKVAQQLSEKRDELVNQFLALVPLLQQLNLLPAPAVQSAGRSAETPASAPPSLNGQAFTLPAFVVGGASSAPSLTEEHFFERFCKHVEESGFKYRRLDLAAFHLSVKCNDLTILGGLPGTGKSSLPRLYTEALAGDEYQGAGGRYLHVGVSPSWLDMRDLLGHLNALDRYYQPAEYGLYQFLIWAQEEEGHRGSDARIYLVCLDEMNLAQVEHYFSGFLQALERPEGQREVRCFAPELVAPTDAFVRWPMLNLPRSLRFVGTVNFDETTRQLSQRVLDRANLIRLRPNYLLDAEGPKLVPPVGPPITAQHFRAWVAPSVGLDRALGELLDRLQEPLARLGCPLNPRRFNAVRKLLGSTPAAILKPEQALDLQIASRILPQARNLFRPGAREAVEALRKALEAHPSGFPEALEALKEMRAGEFSDDLLSAGGEA